MLPPSASTMPKPSALKRGLEVMWVLRAASSAVMVPLVSRISSVPPAVFMASATEVRSSVSVEPSAKAMEPEAPSNWMRLPVPVKGAPERLSALTASVLPAPLTVHVLPALSPVSWVPAVVVATVPSWEASRPPRAMLPELATAPTWTRLEAFPA